MFKKLFGLAVATAAVATCVKVVKDVLNADEEEKNVIDLDDCSCQHEEKCENCDCQNGTEE